MKLVRFATDDGVRLGVASGNGIRDITDYCGTTSMRAALSQLGRLGDANLEAMPWHALADIALKAPIADPQKILAIGMNYQAHAQEAIDAGIPVPEYQLFLY